MIELKNGWFCPDNGRAPLIRVIDMALTIARCACVTRPSAQTALETDAVMLHECSEELKSWKVAHGEGRTQEGCTCGFVSYVIRIVKR